MLILRRLDSSAYCYILPPRTFQYIFITIPLVLAHTFKYIIFYNNVIVQGKNIIIITINNYHNCIITINYCLLNTKCIFR